MKRREFLKNLGLTATGCTIGTGCSHKYFKKKIEQNNSIATHKTYDQLTHIEISLCHHCNLNCAYCLHCSSIAPTYYMPLDIFEKDIAQMAKITKGQIKNIMLLGGEPLLNKNIEEYIKITRKYFNNSQIVIHTNGLLLNDMPDSFWKTCSKYRIEIWHTLYPLYKQNPDLSESYKKSMKHNIKLSPYIRYTFALMRLNNENLNDICKTYASCKYRTKSTIIDNGILYPCPVIFSARLFLNKQFKNHSLPISNNDFLEIHKSSSLAEIQNFLKQPKDFCKYCNCQSSTEQIWRFSKKELCEWYDV